MRRGRRRALVLAALAVTATLGVGGCMPTAVTAQGRSIANLYNWFFAASVVVALIVWGTVTLAILRRKRDDGLPRQIEGNLLIEGIWTGIPLLTVFWLFWLTLGTLNDVNAQSPQKGVTVNVIAFRWQWEFDYPADGIRVVGQLGQNPELVVPAGEPVHISLSAPASDVNHAFFVPQFLFKRDAIAGRTSTFDFTVDNPGTYRGQCAEFCGIYHYDMLFSVHAVTRAEYDTWVSQQRSASQPPPAAGGASAPASVVPASPS